MLNVYLDNGLTYDDESNKLTHSLHYKTDPDMVPRCRITRVFSSRTRGTAIRSW